MATMRGDDGNSTQATNATSLNTLASGEGPAGSVRLVVLGSGLPVTLPLPAEGECVVGRSETADVRIDEESISRKHAIIRVSERITVEDLGSLNGTRVRDRQLKKGDVEEIIPGEAFELGKVMCIVQRRSGAASNGARDKAAHAVTMAGAPDERRRRTMRPHSYVESRLEEELERGATARKIALARFHIEGH
ncbi:MAG TPA: FHA domain-containing protein, partial [Myxococcota bacterium]